MSRTAKKFFLVVDTQTRGVPGGQGATREEEHKNRGNPVKTGGLTPMSDIITIRPTPTLEIASVRRCEFFCIQNIAYKKH